MCHQRLIAITTFNGYPITQGELDSFIAGLKKINMGVDGPVDIAKKAGEPQEKKRDGDLEEWKYNFVVRDHWDNPFKVKSVNVSTVADSKSFQVDATLKFSAEGKIEQIKVYKITESLNKSIYSRGDAAPKPSSSSSGGEPGMPFPVMDSFPSAPKPGQAFLNTSDRHFYAWNGKEWIQLDQPKPAP
jgi:hypothetical protein